MVIFKLNSARRTRTKNVLNWPSKTNKDKKSRNQYLFLDFLKDVLLKH